MKPTSGEGLRLESLSEMLVVKHALGCMKNIFPHVQRLDSSDEARLEDLIAAYSRKYSEAEYQLHAEPMLDFDAKNATIILGALAVVSMNDGQNGILFTWDANELLNDYGLKLTAQQEMEE